MFEVGDKVICIDDSDSKVLHINKIYVIKNILNVDWHYAIEVEGGVYDRNRFISLETYRKRKINNLIKKIKECSKSEI